MSDDIYDGVDGEDVVDLYEELAKNQKDFANAKNDQQKKFKEKYEYEQNMIAQGHYPGKTDTYWDNPYEIKAEKFGQDNWKKWYDKFKKQGLF